jgi:hypothetical protein
MSEEVSKNQKGKRGSNEEKREKEKGRRKCARLLL